MRIVLAAAFAVGAAAFGAEPHSGMVLNANPARGEVTVSVAERAGGGPARVVTFKTGHRADLEPLAPGSLIDFQISGADASVIEALHVRRFEPSDAQGLKVEQLRMLASMAAPLTPRMVRIGEPVPDFTLTDHLDRPVTLSQFRGALVAVSFMYTSCHLPDYCFRLTNNFSLLQQRFAERLGRDLVLLTITFDPIHDQPEVLARYGSTWKADPRGWRLLGGAPDDVRRVCRLFGMNAWTEMGMLAHELRTAVIDRRGRLAASIEGNEFTAQQLGDLVRTLADRSD